MAHTVPTAASRAARADPTPSHHVTLPVESAYVALVLQVLCVTDHVLMVNGAMRVPCHAGNPPYVLICVGGGLGTP